MKIEIYKESGHQSGYECFVIDFNRKVIINKLTNKFENINSTNISSINILISEELLSINKQIEDIKYRLTITEPVYKKIENGHKIIEVCSPALRIKYNTKIENLEKLIIELNENTQLLNSNII